MDNNILQEDQVKDINLTDLVEECSISLIAEKRHQAANLIKNFLMKIEDLTYQVKIKKIELAKQEQKLTETIEKVEKLKKGDWSILLQNQKASKVDSFKENLKQEEEN